MKREVRINGKSKMVEIERQGEGWVCRIDGEPVEADVVETGRGVYSILLGGRGFEARVAGQGGELEVDVGERRMRIEVIDPRRLSRHHREIELAGRRQVTAPMPGKVVRVLAGAGQAVEAGAGILVLEAMKMQNEVRSPKSGLVEQLLVSEGQAVNAGDVLAVVA
ncbi:MAG TPA: biotin/lipoyl-containing protein [Candidatus Acidoferrales bacterium]|nr:biotin/lipoyl-containing protein [Candidatus Acidoferrales bacterium]